MVPSSSTIFYPERSNSEETKHKTEPVKDLVNTNEWRDLLCLIRKDLRYYNSVNFKPTQSLSWRSKKEKTAQNLNKQAILVQLFSFGWKSELNKTLHVLNVKHLKHTNSLFLLNPQVSRRRFNSQFRFCAICVENKAVLFLDTN